MSRRSPTTDQKLDVLIKSVSELKKSQDSSHKELEDKLQKLEDDVAASQELQEDATERAVKRLRRDKPFEFRRKGHEEQHRFNSEIFDHVALAATHLKKILPASDKDKAILEKVKKELEEGASALVECQKHIRIAVQSEHSWEMVAAYIGSDVATNEDDARRIEKAEKTAEQRVSKRKRIAAATAASQRAKRPVPIAGTPAQGPAQPSTLLLPRPAYGQSSSPWLVGPCWNCGEVGHLRSSCPRLNKPYPFMSVDNSHSGVDSMVLAPRGDHGGLVKTGPCSGATIGTKGKPTESIKREAFQGIDEAGTAPGLKLNVVNMPQPECVEWETCQSWGKGTLPRQGVNDQSEQADSGILATEGIDTQAAESWEAECESNQDLALSRFWEMEQGQSMFRVNLGPT